MIVLLIPDIFKLYLADAAIGAGICAIGACRQPQLDDLLKVTGTDEFAI